LKCSAAAAGTIAAGYVRPARAQSRQDVMGAGANPQGSEASRNTYDPLLTCAVKKDANGNDHYDPPAKFKPELAESQKPEQFVVVVDHTSCIDFLCKDKLTFPDLAVPTLCVINSALAKKNATDKDPWAMDWLKNNEAGSGAYRVKKWTPGQELVYQRFDDWKSGPLPKIER
jgi:hypothetical protein